MDEIRFNKPPIVKEEVQQLVKTKPKILKRLLKVFGFLLLIVVVAVLSILGFKNFGGSFRQIEAGNNFYSAVFLNNGQVYFGKIIKNNNTEIVMNEVFYIQTQSPEPVISNEEGKVINQPQTFNLIKVTSELHGPTNEIFINKSEVVFYENLRDDSQVVKAIKGQINN